MLLASLRCWTPLRKCVEIQVDHSEHAQLADRRLSGTVCAYDEDLGGGLLLVHLSEPLRYAYRSATFSPDIVLVSPALRWHGPHRLLLTWSAVHVLNAPSFADRHEAHTVATGRLFLTDV